MYSKMASAKTVRETTSMARIQFTLTGTQRTYNKWRKFAKKEKKISLSRGKSFNETTLYSIGKRTSGILGKQDSFRNIVLRSTWTKLILSEVHAESDMVNGLSSYELSEVNFPNREITFRHSIRCIKRNCTRFCNQIQ